MEEIRTYGIDLLDQGDWSTERLGQALREDLARLEADATAVDSRLENSLLRVVDIVTHEAVRQVLEGRSGSANSLAREISIVFSRFPRLPVLRDLPLRQRLGAALDALLGHLLAAQALPSGTKAEALLAPGRRGAESRRTVIGHLSENAEGLSTQELLACTGMSRQAAHQVLRTLREQALVVTFPEGQSHRHAITPSGRRLWDRLKGDDVRVTVPSKRDASMPISQRRAPSSPTPATMARLFEQLDPYPLQVRQSLRQGVALTGQSQGTAAAA